MSVLLQPPPTMTNTDLPRLAPQGDDNMELASDAGQPPDDDILIDFDDDHEVSPDHDMGEEANVDDEEMSDELDLQNPQNGDGDEELGDVIEDEIEYDDIDINDAEPDETRHSTAPSANAPNTQPSPPWNASTTNEANNKRLNVQIEGADVEGIAVPPTDAVEAGESAAEIPRENDEDELEDPGDIDEKGQDVTTSTVAATTRPSFEHLHPRDVNVRSEGVEVPPLSPSASSKDELLNFPITLRFANADNNLFPLLPEEAEDQPGYLLDDRGLMKKPFTSLFEAFRDRFGEAIQDNIVLGLEFLDLDLSLNEESTFARAAGCSLLSLVDLYVKLSTNDGEESPSPLHVSLTFEKPFYSRFNHLRTAINEGKGLSQVVHHREVDGDYEEGEDGSEEPVDDEEDFHGEGEVYDENETEYQYFEGDEQYGDVADDEDRDYVDDGDENDEPNTHQEGENDDSLEHAPDDRQEQEPQHNDTRPAQTDQSEQHSDQQDVSQGQLTSEEPPQGTPSKENDEPLVKDSPPSIAVNQPDGGEALPQASGDKNSTSTTPKVETRDESASSLMTVNEPSRAHEDEESLIDYSSDEEAGINNPAQKEETQAASTSSSPGNDKKRKRVAFDESTIVNGNSPKKAQKREAIPLPAPPQPTSGPPGDKPKTTDNPTKDSNHSSNNDDKSSLRVEYHEDIIDFSADEAADEDVEKKSDVTTAEVPTRSNSDSKQLSSANGNKQKDDTTPTTTSAIEEEEEQLINYDESDDEDTTKSAPQVNSLLDETNNQSSLVHKTLDEEDEDLIV